MRIARFCGSRFGSSNQRFGLPHEPRQACRRKCKKPAGERGAGGHLPRCKKQCLERRESRGQTRELAARGILVEHALGDATLQFGLHRGERGGRRRLVARRARRFDQLDAGADAADADAVDFGPAVVATDALLGLRRVRHVSPLISARNGTGTAKSRARKRWPLARVRDSVNLGARTLPPIPAFASGAMQSSVPRYTGLLRSARNGESGLAGRTPEGRSPALDVAPDRAAASARLALAAIDQKLLGEIAELAVGRREVAQVCFV